MDLGVVTTITSFFVDIVKMLKIIYEFLKTRTFKSLLGIKKLDKIILTFPSFGIRCPVEINDDNMPQQAKKQRCYCHILDFNILSGEWHGIGPGFRVFPSASTAEIRSISYLSARLKCFSLSPEIFSHFIIYNSYCIIY